jgi:hypothetical protein
MVVLQYHAYSAISHLQYSPTPEYIRIIQHPCEREDSITRDRNCPTCSQLNRIIWDKDHNL